MSRVASSAAVRTAKEALPGGRTSSPPNPSSNACVCSPRLAPTTRACRILRLSNSSPAQWAPMHPSEHVTVGTHGGMSAQPPPTRGYLGMRTPARRARTPNSARGRAETGGVPLLPAFDLQEHPLVQGAAMPARGVKTTLVLKPLPMASRMEEESPCVVCAAGV